MPTPRKPGGARRTLQKACVTKPQRLERLEACISALNLPTPSAEKLLALLMIRPAWVSERELRLLDAAAGQLDIDGVDALAPLRLAVPKGVAKNQLIVDLTRPGAQFEMLTENEKHTGRNRLKALATRRLALQAGRPRRPYEPLALQQIDAIEAANGKKFTFSRDLHGLPGGLALELLSAGLDLVLFASGCPNHELLAQIVCRHRKRHPNQQLTPEQLIALYQQAERQRRAG